MTDLPTACDLFFQYYLKRPDLFMEFYHAVNIYFGIQRDSFRNSFYTQITFFEKLIEYSNDWKQEFIVIIFLQIAEEFLKLNFSPVEEGRKDAITIYQIPLIMSKDVEKYRKLIWESLTSLSKIEKYREKVRRIFSSYGGIIDDISIPVLQFDLKYIELILKLNFPPDKLTNCLLADKIVQVFSRINYSCESLFFEYFKGESFQLYCLLKGPDYEEHKKRKQQSINHYTLNCDLQMFKKLIDVCSSISGTDNHSSWEVGEGLGIAFDAISNKADLYVDAIKYYIQNDTPNNLHPYHLVDNLFSLLSDSEVYEIIISEEYSQKNAWTYAYYHELPPGLITEKHLQGLYDFLNDTSDRYITSSSMRDVDFLDKYNAIDELALMEGCKIILDKKKYSSFIVDIYFGLLFNYHHNTPREVIQKFNCNLELLEEIYCAMLSYDNHCDYDGQFLKEIYSVRTSILDKYIDSLINIDSFSDYQEKYCCFFDLGDFVEIYNKIFEQLIRNCRFPKITVPYFLESLLLKNQNKPDLFEKQDEWICQCIQLFSKDETKMYCLFSVISKLEIERKKIYVLIFLENNPLFEDFGRIPLIPTSWSWSGSAVPMYSDWIEFLESLLPSLVGLKWIKHKNYIETQISYLKRKIESEQIDEILTR